MPEVVVSAQAVLRVRRALLRAAPPRAWIDVPGWRRDRDRWLDLFEQGHAARVGPDDIRGVLELLGEATPDPGARQTAAEWDAQRDALVPELLALLR